MIANRTVIEWLAHRSGEKQLDPARPRYVRKAFELNDTGASFIDSFGKSEISAFVGFVDLVGFTERVKGSSPKDIANHLKPFLEGLAGLVTSRYGLVDKTIGDEVMFVLPDQEKDSGPPAVLLMGQLSGSMYDLQQELGKGYQLRIGLAYGNLLVDRIKGDGFSEWTLFGETVHLAKRLHGLKEIDTSLGIGGAYGVLLSNAKAVGCFEATLGIIAGRGSRMNHKIIESPAELKGISPYRCALLFPQEGRCR